MKKSIALTTYNGSKYIIELLDSLRMQTLKPDEVVIIDDVSSDNTVSIVTEYINKYDLKNWKTLRNDTNLGWKKNFRKAMCLCTGDIIFFCDQDDIWHKDKIEAMVKSFVENKNVRVLISNYVLLSQGSKQKKGQAGSERDDGLLEHIQGMDKVGSISRPGCTQAFTREIKDLMLKYDNMDCAHDHVVYNLGLLTDSLYILNRQLIDFRRHTTNASTYQIKFGKARKSLEAKERVKICDILLRCCENEKKEGKIDGVQTRRNFYLSRANIFDNGNLFQMIMFVLSHAIQYGSARDIAVDLVAMVK